VKVHVEVQRAAKALDQRDRSALGGGVRETGFADQKPSDRTIDDA